LEGLQPVEKWVVHDLSASASRSNQMAPSGLALAMLLHALVALALWWLAKHPPQLPKNEEPIEISFEKPPEPPKPVAKPEPPKPEQAKPQPTPPLSIPPPADITADKATQVPPKANELSNKEMGAPQGDRASLEQTVPPPPQAPPPPADNAFATFKSDAPPPQPQHDPKSKSLLFKPPTPAPPPEPRAQPPRAFALQQKPPAVERGDQPSASPFVNPADVYNRARVEDNYRWQIIRKLEVYRFQAAAPLAPAGAGFVVRIVLARDGRVVDVVMLQSTGFPDVDKHVVAGVRWGSPYAPLPPDIRGNTATFDLPMRARPDM
jgi:protein TonB